ncbi:MAG TPA: hypothetical protein V6D08_11665 [Candidatus Obscuribacterales bacterium]
MREHQIVITLKPEQFLEVQRLSRAAGAKSMGMFVRQQLLAALGIEGTALPPANAAAVPDMKLVAGELKRLHAELKTFVAESLSQAYVTEQPQAPYQAVAEHQGVPAPGEGLPAQYDEEPAEPPADASDAFPSPSERTAEEPSVFAEAQDKLEQFARRAFAISPRLGAIEMPGELTRQPAEQASAKRDPLEDLLDDASAAAPERAGAGDRAEVLPEALVGEGDDEADEDAVFDVPLSLSERARRARPSSGPPDLSGGPPPKRRQ